MIAETSGIMVILAMHIVCNAAAHRYKARARGYGGEPALRGNQFKNIREDYPAFAGNAAMFPIEGNHMVQRAGADYGRIRVQADITITAAVTKRNAGFRTRR
jgi:hypothetical protein